LEKLSAKRGKKGGEKDDIKKGGGKGDPCPGQTSTKERGGLYL